MPLEMDLAFYFHQGRHDFSAMHGGKYGPKSVQPYFTGVEVGHSADIIKLLLVGNRET